MSPCVQLLAPVGRRSLRPEAEDRDRGPRTGTEDRDRDRGPGPGPLREVNTAPQVGAALLGPGGGSALAASVSG